MMSEDPPERRNRSVRELSRECRQLLREELEREGALAAAPFLEAVVLQAALPLGLDEPVEGWTARERQTAAEALRLLLGAAAPGGPSVPDAAARLRGDPRLLAAFFQNIDLLYEHGPAAADAVSLLVMQALDAPGDAG
jgi:hypothetical protein